MSLLNLTTEQTRLNAIQEVLKNNQVAYVCYFGRRFYTLTEFKEYIKQHFTRIP